MESDERQRWRLAIVTFSCPFCGRAKRRQYVALGIKYPPLARRGLTGTHESRLRLPDETDPAIRWSFA